MPGGISGANFRGMFRVVFGFPPRLPRWPFDLKSIHVLHPRMCIPSFAPIAFKAVNAG